MRQSAAVSTMSDEELVERVLDGLQDAYDELMRRHQPAVARRIGELVRDYDLADDLVQRTFLIAFDSLAKHDPTRKFSGWLNRIAYNTAMDYFRQKRRARKKRRDTVTLDAVFDSKPYRLARAPATPSAGRIASKEAKFAVRSRVLETAIRTLPRNQRRCIRLRFYQRRTNKQAARILGMPLGTVKTHVHRGLENLQQVLDPLADSLLIDSGSDPFYTPNPLLTSA